MQFESTKMYMVLLYLIIINKINMKRVMQKDKTPNFQFHNNYDYLNFIRKNHLIIEDGKQKKFALRKMSQPFTNKNLIKSEFDQQHQENFASANRRSVHNNSIFSTRRDNATNQQIFVHPDSKKRYQPNFKSISPKKSYPNGQNGPQDEKLLTYDMIMEIMHNKNQEIAQSLMKQRQSMSDIVYSGPKSFERLPNHGQVYDKKLFVHQKLVNQPSLKFPQLVQKKITYGTTNLQKKISEKRSVRQKLAQFTIQKERDYKSVDGDNSHNIDYISVQKNTNNQLLKAYYNKKGVVQIRQQPYTIIPQFQSPKKKREKRQQKKRKTKNGKKQAVNLYNNKDVPSTNQMMQNQLKNFLESKILQRTQQKPSSKTIINGEDGLILSDLQKRQSVVLQKIQISKQQEQPEFIQNKQQEENIEEAKKQNEQNPEQLLQPIQSQTKLTKKTSIAKNKSKKNFLQSERQKDCSIYQGKIRSYRQFLFQMNLVHRTFDPLVLKEEQNTHRVDVKYKYYVGKGNNSLLIKSLMKRRFWWVSQEDPKKANFVWTQLKLNHFYQYQPRGYLDNPYDKIEIIEPQQTSIKKKTLKKKESILSPAKPIKNGGYKPPLPQGVSKIFTNSDEKLYNEFMENADFNKISNFQNRLKYFPNGVLQLVKSDKTEIHMHNHFEFNYFIGNKKAMFYNLKQYYELTNKNLGDIIPLTFHIQKGVNDPQYIKFLKEYKRIKLESSQQVANKKKGQKIKPQRNIWIVKPGEISNRGMGITVIQQVYQLNNILKKKEKHGNGSQKTYIIQKYIERPMLYNRRKFDIRHYMIVTRLHSRMRAYWYGQGYIRTSSYEYNIDQIDNQQIHLTNDAIQKETSSYGKYEEANKLSYSEFQRYLDSTFPDKKYSFSQEIYPRMKEIALDAFKSCYLKMDPNCYQSNFEVFGLDFMIDSNFKVSLIQVNTNPCLQINCNILNRIIPTMLQHCFRMTIDVVFPPNNHYPNSVKYLTPDNPLQRLQYQLIFDQARDGKQLHDLYKDAKPIQIKDIESDDEIYQNEGKQLDLDGDIE